MIFDPEALEDALVSRLQEAVTDGLISYAGVVGDDAELQGLPELPALVVIFRRAAFNRPEAIDVTRQMGIVEWSVFAAGQNLRGIGLRAGRLGGTGAYQATHIALRYLVGFNIADGFPLWVNYVDLASYDPRSEKAMYEIGVQHEWPLVEYPYEQ